MRAELLALRRLQRCGVRVEPESVEILKRFFEELRALEQSVNDVSPRDLWEGQWALLGLLARAYQLTICSVEMLGSKNWNGFYASSRALAEGVAALAWAHQKIDRLPTVVRLEPTSVGKILNAGYARHPTLKNIYIEMSQSVHPGRSGHLLGFHPKAQDGRGVMTSFTLDFSDYFFERKLAILLRLSKWFINDIRLLFEFENKKAATLSRVMASSRSGATPRR